MRGGLNKFKVISLGAEAIIALGYFLGRKVIYKLRVPKPYRDPKLDATIRKERTLTESRIMLAARKAGVKVPLILLVDLDLSLIVMEYIEGKLLKNVLNNLSTDEIKRVSLQIGRQVGLLHKLSIVHGDLTTSNMVLRNGDVYFIDFGLAKYSNDLEDMGVDVHIFQRSLESMHFSIKDLVIDYFLKGYEEVVGSGMRRKIESKVREIRLRGRYVEERREGKS